MTPRQVAQLTGQASAIVYPLVTCEYEALDGRFQWVFRKNRRIIGSTAVPRNVFSLAVRLKKEQEVAR